MMMMHEYDGDADDIGDVDDDDKTLLHCREKVKLSTVFVTCVVFNIPCVANFSSAC
jgi:hypothetical protein